MKLCKYTTLLVQRFECLFLRAIFRKTIILQAVANKMQIKISETRNTNEKNS